MLLDSLAGLEGIIWDEHTSILRLYIGLADEAGHLWRCEADGTAMIADRIPKTTEYNATRTDKAWTQLKQTSNGPTLVFCFLVWV